MKAPAARVARVARVDVGVGGAVELAQPLDSREAGFDDAAGPASAVAFVDLGGEDLGQVGLVGEAFLGGHRGDAPGLVAYGRQVQGPARRADGGLGRFLGEAAHRPAPVSSSS